MFSGGNYPQRRWYTALTEKRGWRQTHASLVASRSRVSTRWDCKFGKSASRWLERAWGQVPVHADPGACPRRSDRGVRSRGQAVEARKGVSQPPLPSPVVLPKSEIRPVPQLGPEERSSQREDPSKTRYDGRVAAPRGGPFVPVQWRVVGLPKQVRYQVFRRLHHPGYPLA